MFGCFALTLWSFFNLDKNYTDYIAAYGTPISLFLLAASFMAHFGPTKIVTENNFLLEKTPYRIIVSIDRPDSEYFVHQEFKDAQYVNQADKIKSISLEIPRNAWGLEVTWDMKVRPIISN